MTVKTTARKQYSQIVDRMAERLATAATPPEGWLTVLRKALGMSGSDVAARAGVSRNAVYQAERNERDGAITINQMQKLAQAMGGRFVYAIIPEEGNADSLIRAQARRKAEARVQRASAHMALEKQSLTSAQTAQRVDDLTDEMLRDAPSDFWKSND
ncbi:mobile mystery protein A [Aquibium sp. ELW1220]|uniref:mobile mystery protein A n=1 Tax=Aquibium sp. ELW1220 TaxID=2976766 RepID=UPI0025B12F6F|nr:mobile mystery protein A [Aquibium sp. ELW1220]MDN2582331.1 mobile mystery protein A [Aquibium sp. ELW1220]